MSLRILTAENIKQLVTELPLQTLLSHTAKVFYQVSHRPEEIQCPPRSRIEGEHYTTLTMPGHVRGLGLSVKIVAVPKSSSGEEFGTAKSIGPQSIRYDQPGTQRTGLPATTIVFDESTGIAQTVLNARHSTALRTAAGSLLASQLLLDRGEGRRRRPPRKLALFAAGTQIEYHARLLLEGFPSIESCYILNRSCNSRAIGLVDRLARTYPSKRVELFTPDSNTDGPYTGIGESIGTGDTASPDRAPSTWFPEFALQSDILCFATSAHEPLIDASLASSLKPGAHLILIGSYTPSMHEVSTEVIQRASKVVVDSREHAMREAGELIDAGLDEKRDVVELGELINEDGEPVEEMVTSAQKGDITIFKSVGLAVQDVMIARLLCSLAADHSIGTLVNDFD